MFPSVYFLPFRSKICLLDQSLEKGYSGSFTPLFSKLHLTQLLLQEHKETGVLSLWGQRGIDRQPQFSSVFKEGMRHQHFSSFERWTEWWLVYGQRFPLCKFRSPPLCLSLSLKNLIIYRIVYNLPIDQITDNCLYIFDFDRDTLLTYLPPFVSPQIVPQC